MIDIIMIVVIALDLIAIITEEFSLGIVLITSCFFCLFLIIRGLQKNNKLTTIGVLYLVAYLMMLVYSVLVLFFNIDVKAFLRL